jgi:hypothetical protein
MADEPCSGWAPNHGLCPRWADFDAATQAYADEVATRVIWAATGRQFGLCTVTVRPCWSPQAPLYQAFPVGFYGEGFWTLQGVPGGVQLIPGASCSCADACQCSPPQVPLPGPVASITQVVIDGVVLAAGNYRLDGNFLVRQDGQAWPAPQNLALPDGQVGTWHVTYQLGQAVPATLNDAAGLYACELGKARVGGSCQLPNRVRSITRQGVSIDYVSEEDYLVKGRTGYDAVDSIIVSYNPYGLVQPPRVVSLDMPQYR